MPKVKISEYSATANSNTDVASINIDEGCAPSGINNAIRAVMGHLKDFQQGTYGDPFNGPVNGTLGATTANTAVVTTLNSTDATDASSTTAAAMKTAGGLGVAKKLFVGLDSNIYGLTVGRGAGAVATNTAVGASALAANTSGIENNAFGNSALLSNTTGGSNVAFGTNALRTNITGSENTALGHQVLYASTGSFNTGAGSNTLRFNTSGANNTAFGYNSLFSNTTASNNTAVGYQAGYSNTTGTTNTFIGFQAALANTTGSNATFLGSYAGYSNTTSSTNAFIGAYSGYFTTGASNTFVGISAGETVTTGAKNTILGRYNGNQGGLDIRTASNYIVLSDGDGNPRGVCFDTGGWTFSNGGTSDVVGARSGNGANTTNSLYVGYYSATGPTNGTLSFNVTTNGNVTNTNNSYGSLSDIKLKENIVDASPKLSDMMQVRVVNYNFKEGQTHKQIGVIAQELQQVFPGMVDESPDRDEEGNDLGTTTKQVKYSVFVPMLIKAIQELKAEVDSLKAQINGASA
jgi:hypothetical protein